MLGLDPDARALWGAPAQANGSRHEHSEQPLAPAASAVLAHCRELIEATSDRCVAVKLQLARFEALGADGWLVARAVAEYAHALGLLVIADGKRGDIDVSAHAYAGALFDGVATPFGLLAGLKADAVTVNPLMGRDSMQPFISAARASGGGVLVLVRTSNPGARDVQDLALSAGGSVWERLATLVHEAGADGVGVAGLSDVGAVIGATQPAHLPRARELMPHAVFLLPGVGAQGGRVEELLAAFLPGQAAGLITASRSISDAHRQRGGTPADAARAEAERLRETTWAISQRAFAEAQGAGGRAG